jgi:hypothetical protein
MSYPTGFHIFGTLHDEQGIEEAKKYIAEHNLTSDDVKIVHVGGMVSVVCKREVEVCARK